MPDNLPPPLGGIKLVAWDLDDTLWRGTLEEGEITWLTRRVELVVALAAAGVMNSICSNNEFTRAMAVLRERDIWRYFVFPRITWEDKVDMLEELIADSRLRPEQIAFIDDKPRIREAVRRRHPKIRVLAENALDALNPGDLPRLDPELQRLDHYRLLERKARHLDRGAAPSDRGFLRQSDVRISIDEHCDRHRERILELLQRTNQLNFTKLRLDGPALDADLRDTELLTATVHVQDRYGDYGIAGFYALDTRQHRLRHFVFSCRILHMGVEQYLWQLLGRPGLQIVSPVASDPREDVTIDWIGTTEHEPRPVTVAPASTSVLVKGGCDLLAMRTYLESHGDGEAFPAIDWEVLDHHCGVQRYGHSSLSVLLSAGDVAAGSILDRLPWLSNWRTRMFGGFHDWICLSLWVDYACTRYRHRQSGLTIPLYEPLGASAPEALWDFWWGDQVEHRDWFRREFVEVGPVSPDDLIEELREVRARVPDRSHLLVLNGSEAETEFKYPCSRFATQRHLEINRALDTLAPQAGITILDVRPHTAERYRLLDMQTHFTRDTSFALANSLRKRLGLPTLDPGVAGFAPGRHLATS